MTRSGADPQQWLRDYTTRVGEIGARAQQTQETIGAATGRAEGAAGAVRVEVGPGGRLEDLSLDARAMRLSPDELARVITTAVREAHHATATQVQAALHELTGDSEAFRFVTELTTASQQADDAAHGVVPSDTGADRGGPPPQRADDDDYFGGSVLR